MNGRLPPPDWPFRDRSRLVPVRPHLWHVQDLGAGPDLLMLHGAGASTHSWAGLVPLLAADFRAILIDLPGQGYTRLGARDRCGLAAMTEDVATLIRHEGWRPLAVIGHSAGAAIALQLALAEPDLAPAVVGINAALGNFEGVEGWLFPLLARLLALNPLVPRVFARLSGTEAQVRRLIASTGSDLPPADLARYVALVRKPEHVDATLAMMAQWRLDRLIAALPRIAAPVLLIVGETDRAVPPSVSRDAAKRLPQAELVCLPGLGHLCHEEEPAAVAGPIRDFLARIRA
ncbi:MAG: alpha/beta fold hydrolase BchO [Gemmobacter sp.]